MHFQLKINVNFIDVSSRVIYSNFWQTFRLYKQFFCFRWSVNICFANELKTKMNSIINGVNCFSSLLHFCFASRISCIIASFRFFVLYEYLKFCLKLKSCSIYNKKLKTPNLLSLRSEHWKHAEEHRIRISKNFVEIKSKYKYNFGHFFHLACHHSIMFFEFVYTIGNTWHSRHI